MATLNSAWRKVWINLRYQTVIFGAGCRVESGVIIRATDGGVIVFGCNVHISRMSELICKHGEIKVGDNSFIGPATIVTARQSIIIGADALVAENVTIRDQQHGTDLGGGPYREQPFVNAPILIGRNVWIGAKATLLKGITIGDSAIIGAGSLVNKNVAANDVVGGVPAKVIESRQTGK